MNKHKIKQIYLLMIIVFGIVTLSVYSTYSIFTLESQSDDIVSIHTPSNLNVTNNTYEYQQISISGNSYISTDLDIYNNTESELCYAIWYKIATNSVDADKIKVYQNTADSLLTSSVISGISNRRISIFIINDNNVDVKVNVGLIYSLNNGTCELNIPNDKLQVVSTINNPISLSDTLIKGSSAKEIDGGYLTYEYKDKELTFDSDKMINISNQFSLDNEMFSLEKMEEIIDDEKVKIDKQIRFEDLINYQNYYFCLNDNKCDLLYRVKNVNKKDNRYVITNYDILVPYMSSVVGIRKVNNNYYYYGDNPNNFVYYNCANELDIKTCELWRIIGFVNDNGKYLTKLIRNDSIGKYKYDNQVWKSSDISKYLNKDYKLSNASTLKEYSFKQENITDLNIRLNDIKYLDNVNKSNILLMSLSDYFNASVCENKKINEYTGECISNNWLNNKLIDSEYTISVKYQELVLDDEENEISPLINDIVYAVGGDIKDVNISSELDVRPVVYLSSRTLLIGGSGTFNNPYVLR